MTLDDPRSPSMPSNARWQFYPANGVHATVGVSSRVMNYLCNLNSKTFFRFVREDDELLNGYRPISAHVNYHPEKPNRMVDLHAWYS